MPKLINGAAMCVPLQREALRRFVHRYTAEHVPAWVRAEAARGIFYPQHFETDADWLAHTEFFVNVDGTLSKRPSHCHSRPTFPRGRSILHALPDRMCGSCAGSIASFLGVLGCVRCDYGYPG